MKKAVILIGILWGFNASADSIIIETAGFGNGFSESSACEMARFQALTTAKNQCTTQNGIAGAESCSSTGYTTGLNMYSCYANCTLTCEFDSQN